MIATSASILIVDDRPDKLLSLEAILEELGQPIVCVETGREALRRLLKEEFAVILLDVNMPGMDGFETAQLIRQRRNCAGMPIIFLTAMGDELHATRSYSLGAVDYILTPVVPQILRSKVGVFVDLFKKNQQVRMQAERLRQRASQLHQLTTASIAINSAPSVDKIIEITTTTARQIIDTHQAATFLDPKNYPLPPSQFASHSSKYAASGNGKPGSPIDNPALMALLSGASKPIRMGELELETQVPQSGNGASHGGSVAPPLRGLLAAPLTGRGGGNIGTIVLTEKADGEFTDDDQAMLTQLAQMASVAIENTLFAEERKDNRLKEEFLSTLSHELRTPLNAMSGWIQLLRREPVGGEVAHGLQVIERNVQAQTKLIEDLLDLSRITTGKLRVNARPVLLRPLLEAAIDSLRPVMVERQIALSCQLDASGAMVVGDPDRLQQVFWNLLSNAAKFTPAGGKVNVNLRSVGGLLRVTIEDTGQGIDREFLPHIFDRFRQADSTISRRHGGLGIGLTIVRHLIQLQGGVVTGDSAGKGRGSIFTVTLPEAPSDHHELGQTSDGEADELPSLQGISVLLVDDHPDARDVVSEILRHHQAKVESASSTRQALDCLATYKPDLLVTDLGMPEEDGFSLLRQLRGLPAEQGGQMPVIALTAYASADDRHQVLQAGFQAHLAKPVDPRQLVSAVHRFSRRNGDALLDLDQVG